MYVRGQAIIYLLQLLWSRTFSIALGSAERKNYTAVLIVAITHYETITMFDV